MRLFGFDWGIYPRRLLIYLDEKGITDIERINLDMIKGENREPWFLEINPAGTVPVLETNDGTLIRETSSIIEYVEELFPQPNLIGLTPEARALARDRANLANVAYAFGNTYIAQFSPLLEGRVTRSEGGAAAMREEFLRQLHTLENLAGDGAYLGGDEPDISDINFFASAQYYDLFYKLELPDSCPRLKAIYERFAKRPSARPPQYPEAVAKIAPVPESARL